MVCALGMMTACKSGTGKNGGSTDWVDLDLPSGLLWATCNVGANSPEEYGNYYAWGETTPKKKYTWNNYKYSNNGYNHLTKYCSNYYDDFIDYLSILEPDDDAATVFFGDGARTPTADEWEELMNSTKSEWVTRNGVNGRMFVASNGNSIFLPATSCIDGKDKWGEGFNGRYWSSTCDDYVIDALTFEFHDSSQYMSHDNRRKGYTVRAVRQKNGEVSNVSKVNKSDGCGKNPADWVDLGLPNGLLWAKCNLGANSPEEFGDYYAWGEIQPKSVYDWSTHKYCTVNNYGDLRAYTKYNTRSSHGIVDNLTKLQTMDDAASSVLGDGARMPMHGEWEELIKNTTSKWTTLNGVKGRLLTGPNGNTLFLPATGYRLNDYWKENEGNYYWTSSLAGKYDGYGVWCFEFDSLNQYCNTRTRCYGFSVRAVCRK